MRKAWTKDRNEYKWWSQSIKWTGSLRRVTHSTDGKHNRKRLSELDNCTSLRYSLTSLLCQTIFSLSRATMMPYCHWLVMEISWMLSYCHSRIMSFLMTQWVWGLIMGVLGVWFWYSLNFLADESCLLMSWPAEIPSTYAVRNLLFYTLHNWMMPSPLAFQ